MGLLNGCLEPPLSPGSFAHPDGLRASCKASQLFADEFWRRWLREYLPLLNARQKWLVPLRNFRVGDLVLLVDNQSLRNEWPRAIITDVYSYNHGAIITDPRSWECREASSTPHCFGAYAYERRAEGLPSRSRGVTCRIAIVPGSAF